jgi:hypothetical protein
MSGINLDVPLDEAWAVSTADGDDGHAEVTFADSDTLSEITLRGPSALLIGLLQTALADLLGEDAGEVLSVTPADPFLDRMAAAARPLPLTDAPLAPEQMLTADSMEPGGWVRIVPGPVWREVIEVFDCRGEHLNCRGIVCKDGAVEGLIVHVDPATTYPYLSAEDFDAHCDAEQAHLDEASDRMAVAEIQADRAEDVEAYHQRMQELQAERAKDLGFDEAS